jgi:hypothetical protein
MPAGYTAGMSRAESGRRQGGSRLTVARYIRISTEEQRKGYSVRDQRRRLNEHSERGDGRNWSRAVLRQIVLSDCYLPYSFDDLQLLTEGGNLDRAVLAGLDPERVHGVWWFNRERVEVCNKDGGKTRRFEDNPREEWVAVPVPVAGVPREHALEARRRVPSNRAPSNKHATKHFQATEHSLIQPFEPGED